MCHGDDNGLRVPPRLAPIQAYVMVVKDGDGVGEAAAKLRDALRDAGVRVALDDRVDTPFGRRAVDAELQGLSGTRRGRPARPGRRQRGAWSAGSTARRRPTPVADVVGAVLAALEADQQALHDEALALPRGAHRRGGHAGRGDRGGRRPAGPGCRGRRSASAGEAEANGQGVTVRCLVRADGSVPDSEDEPGPGRRSWPAPTDAVRRRRRRRRVDAVRAGPADPAPQRAARPDRLGPAGPGGQRRRARAAALDRPGQRRWPTR